MRKPFHILKDLPGHPGYRISSRGKIFKNGVPVRASFNNCGYLRVRVEGKRYFVHRLVAESFIPNPQNLPVVMHLDNCKTHNSKENLRWGTYSDNLLQASKEHRLPTLYQKGKGNGLKGDNHPNSKLTEVQRIEVKNLFATGKYSLTQLGKRYGVTRVTIAKYV